ncbi:MAG: DUF3644 domain-containing protein [Candidatus Latescibacteria bacterium]|nr:DUF3644 domain-containing protein [Candidatus Latescibacterota bacterium]
MKSSSEELIDRSIAATVAAIEIYNKPNFPYREETFSILAINGWELLLKAKWLKENDNKVDSLYVMENYKKKDELKIKYSRSGNPFTHSLDYLAKKLVEQRHLGRNVWANIEALTEIRDSSIHFYNLSGSFAVRIQEIGIASLQNFALLVKEWFGRDLSEYNFYLMPLSFITPPTQIVLNKEEKNFLAYLEQLEANTDEADTRYSVTVNIDVKFTRSKSKDVPDIRVTSNPNAPEVRITEEQIREQYPWDYKKLTDECRDRYSDFKINKDYHHIRKCLCEDKSKKFCKIRYLDLGNSRSPRKQFFKPDILKGLDEHYSQKER